MSQAQGEAQGSPSKRERQQLKTQQKEAEQRARRRTRLLRKGAQWSLLGVIAAGLAGIGYSIATAKRLPPTGMTDHIEVSPPGHILAEPMPLAIQKHMLEHADGGGPPGMIINYNCVKFRCSEGLVEHLTRIAVTRLGKILVLDEVDERRIEEFIKG